MRNVRQTRTYKPNNMARTTIQQNKAVEGETIEQKVNRAMHNKEPITDGAPIIYQPRDEGVKAAYNVRTDRFEVALEAMDTINRGKAAQRTGKPDPKVIELKGEDGKAESTDGTDNK